MVKLNDTKQSKAFNIILKWGSILYILLLAFMISESSKVNNVENNTIMIISIISPLLFSTLLKSLYEYLVSIESINGLEMNKKDMTLESNSVSFILTFFNSVIIMVSFGLFIDMQIRWSVFLISFIILYIISRLVLPIIFNFISKRSKIYFGSRRNK